MNYLKVYTDFETSIEMLSDAEVGRLFRAMLRYADRGEVTDLCGNERFLWGAAKVGIDHEQEYRRQRAANGAAGGRPQKANKSKEKQKKAKESKQKQTKANKSRNEYETNSEYEYESEDESFISAERTSAQVITLPLVDKTEYPITENDVTEWANAYPAVDVLAELRRMRVWLNANPTRKKTKAGIRRFANSWLGHTQDTAKPQKEKKGSKYAEIYEKY